jgi:hypothetical protein
MGTSGAIQSFNSCPKVNSAQYFRGTVGAK